MLLKMPVLTRRSKKLLEAVEEAKQGLRENEVRSAEIIILPPAQGAESDLEDIDDDYLGEEIPAEVAGDLEIFMDTAPDITIDTADFSGSTGPPRKKPKGKRKVALWSSFCFEIFGAGFFIANEIALPTAHLRQPLKNDDFYKTGSCLPDMLNSTDFSGRTS